MAGDDRKRYMSGSGWHDTPPWPSSERDTRGSMSSQVAGAAASGSVRQRERWSEEDVRQGSRYFDNQNIGDMEDAEQEEAKTTSRRVEKLGKAFQNYRRSIIKKLREMVEKKKLRSLFEAWRSSERSNSALADLVWTVDDMDHFLRTVASFDTHKAIWKPRRQDRQKKCNRDYGKLMPRMIPPNLVHLFQITLAHTHKKKFIQHFGNAFLDGSLHTPIQVLAERDGVAVSAVVATNVQINSFTNDTLNAIYKNTFGLNQICGFLPIVLAEHYGTGDHRGTGDLYVFGDHYGIGVHHGMSEDIVPGQGCVACFL